jgi:hypothetical protein
MPTALFVPPGQAWLSYYWVDTRAENPHAPQSLSIAAAYIGLTPKTELQLTYVKPESVNGATTIGLEYLASAESGKLPAIGIGAEDITRESGDTSVYVALAKTVTAKPTGPPRYPIVRLHLGYGTEPRSAFFGGAQLRVSPEIGLTAANDGHDSIFSLSYFVPKTTWVLKAGTWGDARWVGAQYTIPFH